MYKDKIKAFYHDYTEKKRRVADFFLLYPLESAFLSVGELAERLSVDTNTVIALCQQAGYSGITDLKRDIQDYLLSEFGGTEGLRAPLSPEEKYQIQAIYRHNDENVIAQAKKMIASANRIYLVCEGTAQFFQTWLLNCLVLRNKTVIVPDGTHVGTKLLSYARKEDVIVYVTSDKTMNEAIRGYQNRTKLVSFVSDVRNESVGTSDIPLLAPSHDPFQLIGLHLLLQRVIPGL